MSHDDDTCPYLVRVNLLESENARLKAEVERLTSVSEAWKKRRLDKVEAECINWAEVEKENARLKAELERYSTLVKIAHVDLIAQNARLKAEVERLKSLCDKLGMGGKHTITAITEENALLKAEVDRLADENARLTMMKDACKRMIKRRDKWIWEKRAELERLRASSFVTAVPVEHYERVVKAGDDVFCIACNAPSSEGRQKILQAWRAAKEGKPSV